MQHWAPLHDRPVDAVTRKDIATQLEHLRTERGPRAAASARGYLSTVYGWAMRQGLAEHNPVVGTEAPEKPTTAARVLKPVELVAIWNACERMGDFGRIVRLLMLLGQRRSEVSGLRWSEIDLPRKLWVIPIS
jgi:integrase